MKKAPNQIMKTEIILGGITTAMGKLSGKIYTEEHKDNPDKSAIERDKKKRSDFAEMRHDFYSSGTTSDDEYYRLLRIIKNEIQS